MRESTMITFREMSETEYGQLHPARRGIPTGGKTMQAESPVTLDEIRARVGPFFIPTHLPDGFMLTDSTLTAGRSPLLRYQGPDGTRVTVRQDKMPVNPMVKTGSVEPVRVGTNPGYIVRGLWMRLSSSPNKVSWRPDHQSVVYFEKDEWWVRVRVLYPMTGVDESELLRIAESVIKYEG